MRASLFRALAPLVVTLGLIGALQAPAVAQEDPPADSTQEPTPLPAEPTPLPAEPTPEPTPEPAPAEPTPEPTPVPTPLPAEEDLELPTPTPEPTPLPSEEDATVPTEPTEPTEGEEEEEEEAPPTCKLPADGEDEATGIPVEGNRCLSSEELSRVLVGYEAAASEEAQLLNGIRDSLDQLEELEGQIEVIDAQLVEVGRRLLAAQAEVAYAEIRQDSAEERLASVEMQLEEERAILREQAVAAYIGGGEAGRQIDQAMLSADNVRDIESTREYGEAVVEDRRKIIDRVTELEAAAESLTAELDLAAAETEVIVEDIDAIEASAERIREQYDVLLDDEQERIEDQATLVAQVRSEKDQYAAQLGIAAQSSGSIAVLLQGRGGTGALSEDDLLARPLANLSISSVFGPRLHPIFSIVRMHTGIDAGGAPGESIYASGDGVVVIASEQGGYGNTVVIDHGDGVATLYAHQSAFAVRVGDTVEEGDLIGFVGSTGFSTGPHLHFEVRLNGIPVDPLPYLDLRAITAS